MSQVADLVRFGAGLAQSGDLQRLEQDFQKLVHLDPNNPDVYFILGALAHREGRHEAAIDAVGRAIALAPGNSDYHCVLGAASLALGRLDTAADSYREAIRLRPDEAQAHEGLGRILAMQGHHAEAVVALRRLLDIRPGDEPALASLASHLIALGRPNEVVAACQQALQRGAAGAEAHKHLGLIAMQRGRPDEAAAALRQAVELRPDDPDLRNDLGVALARMGRRDEAEACYREALRLRTDFADAHNNLGNVLRNRGRHDEAVAAFREALRFRPAYPEAHNNLAITLRAQGKLDEAIAHYQRLALRPTYAEALNNMGFALAHRGKADAAVVCFQQAARLMPNYFEAHHNLANSLSDQGRHDEAIAAYREAIRLRPGEPRVLKGLAITLSRREKHDEAVATFRQVLQAHPDFPDAWNDLGITLARQGRHHEAIDAYREAIKYRPSFPEAYNNMANGLRNVGRFDESVACYRKALELRPNYADAHNNLGIALSEMGRFDDAVASYTRCLELRPDHVDAHMNRALTWLRKGDYAQGWAEYEWRWKKRSLTSRPLIMPQWNGFPLTGRRIVLFTEQGLGDTLQFVRFCRVLKRQGPAAVILECPEVLVKVLARTPGIDYLVPQGQPLPQYDVYCPLLNVPGLTATSVESIPAEVPYIVADPELVERWRHELAAIPEFKVGINWQGNPKYAGDRHRSIPLAAFEPLARIPGVRLFSIQQMHGLDQLKAVEGNFPVTDLSARLNQTTGPFMDTAAVMMNLDLVISCDSSPAHLAGALGVPVWMPISSTPDWRWLTHREDTPWYPSMRIFRQGEHMVWGPVFERMAAELRALVRVRARTPSVTVGISPGELMDKIAVLEIKAERFRDPLKLGRVQAELAALTAARDHAIVDPAGIADLATELRGVNEALWTIADRLRECERTGDFGTEFVELARSEYCNGDRRAAIKRQINERLRSEIVEEGLYGASEAPDSEEAIP